MYLLPINFWSLNLLELWEPIQACNGIPLPFTFSFTFDITSAAEFQFLQIFVSIIQDVIPTGQGLLNENTLELFQIRYL
jgi:hypothetical protein